VSVDPATAGPVAGGDGPSLLEIPTKLVTGQTPGWWLSVYPQAREAGGCFVSSVGRGEPRFDPGDEEQAAAGRAERSKSEAARRARGQVRRYCAAHRLNRLGTLTYRGEGCHDPKVLRTDVARFFKVLRRMLGGESFPYLWVPEWHPGGHGLHVHFAVGRFVRRTLIEAAWPHGLVHIKQLGDLPVGSGVMAEARKTARYLSKYVSKGPAAGSGLHRYEVAQGYRPTVTAIWGRTAAEAIAKASVFIGERPEHVWSSAGTEGWAGPPATWVCWP